MNGIPEGMIKYAVENGFDVFCRRRRFYFLGGAYGYFAFL
jgi:hypothetical protein